MPSTPLQVAAGAAVPLASLAWRMAGKYLGDHFTRKFTVLHELEHIGVARPDNQRIKGTAVICGGRCVFCYLKLTLLTVFVSIAGLWSALAAADHFEDVLIVEPEAWVGTDLGMSNSHDAAGERIREKAPLRTRVMQYTNTFHGMHSHGI